MANNILHLVPADFFRAIPESEPYLPEAFAADGFIHCTREPDLLLQIANALFKDLAGQMLTLVIDPDKLTAPLKWEPPIPPPEPNHPLARHLFPHIYGPLNREAIVAIRPAGRDSEGNFVSV